jgi:hypothetical protein
MECPIVSNAQISPHAHAVDPGNRPSKTIAGVTDNPMSCPDADGAATARPRKFYHGTQTPVHLLADPYLDPVYAQGGDDGDPMQPHVFVTPNKLVAKLFAVKTPEAIYIAENDGFPVIVFCCEPKDTRGGWVYTCLESPSEPFEELIVGGRHTDKWVSYRKTSISEPEHVSGLEQLVEQDNLQLFILKQGIDRDEWKRDRTFDRCRLWPTSGLR